MFERRGEVAHRVIHDYIQLIDKTRRASALSSLKWRPGCNSSIPRGSNRCLFDRVLEHYNIRYYNIIGRCSDVHV